MYKFMTNLQRMNFNATYSTIHFDFDRSLHTNFFFQLSNTTVALCRNKKNPNNSALYYVYQPFHLIQSRYQLPERNKRSVTKEITFAQYTPLSFSFIGTMTATATDHHRYVGAGFTCKMHLRPMPISNPTKYRNVAHRFI